MNTFLGIPVTAEHPQTEKRPSFIMFLFQEAALVCVALAKEDFFPKYLCCSSLFWLVLCYGGN